MSNSNFEKLTIKELIDYCKLKNIKGYSGKNKKDIINLISKFEYQNNNNSNIKVDLIFNENKNISMKYKLVELFAGTGAFTLAFHNTNKAECVFANDFANSSKYIYDMNFQHKLILKDINDIHVSEIPVHDILTAGFPCQPFSIAGNKKGFEDTRTNTFWKILEIVDNINPLCIVLENVKNLVTHDNCNSFKIITDNLYKRDYFIKYKVLNTCEITDVPQNRERIYIICIKNNHPKIKNKYKVDCIFSKNIFETFSLDYKTCDKKDIKYFLENNVNSKYYYSKTSSIWENLNKTINKNYIFYQYRRYYTRENKNNNCPTLTANMGTGGHNVPIIKDSNGIRKLTPRECFNFQGFPSTYKLPNISDSHLYKLSGNAVSVPVVQLIANSVIEFLDKITN